MFLTHLECTACGLRHDWHRLQNLCTKCGKPLFAIYDLTALSKPDRFKRSSLSNREKSLWRWRELLPLPKDAEPVSLGEGGTPVARSPLTPRALDSKRTSSCRATHRAPTSSNVASLVRTLPSSTD